VTAAAAAFVRDRAQLAARLPAVALGLSVAPVLAANGGYFPNAWGWAAMGLGGAAAVAAIARTPSQPSVYELVFIGGLTLYTAWLALSLVWTEAPTATPLEVERALVYVGAAVAVKAIVRRRHVPHLLGGVLAGMALICCYALATRLLPDHFTAQTFGGNRLNRPIGYWNALGLVAAMATLLALAFAARATHGRNRALAAATVPLLLTTLYFTYSRGATLALAGGLLVLVGASTRRMQLLAASLPIALVSAFAVYRASRAAPLTHTHVAEAAQVQSGHHLALILAACAVAAGYAAFATSRLERRISVSPRVTRIAGWATAAVAVLVLVGGLAAVGGPQKVVHKAYKSISSNPPTANGNLNNRLFSLSSNGRLALWHVAVHAWERSPVVGLGPGSYEQEWLAHRHITSKVSDAHNLYLEQLAEDGLIGLGLLLAAIAAPIAIFGRARREPLAAGALAAFSAYLLHSFVDWDWELSGVTLAALLCGGALLAAGRSESRAGRWRSLPIVVGTVVTLLAFAGLAGNLALGASHDSVIAGNYNQAIRQAKRAAFWQPWSSLPWQYRGEAELALGGRTQALADFRKAASKDDTDSTLWLDIARVTTGKARAAAIATAVKLDPLDAGLAGFGRDLGRRP
jgi:O-Antigen ligase